MVEGEITNAYAKILEDLIISNPRFWLWSHKRWKHSRLPQAVTEVVTKAEKLTATAVRQAKI